ncbi:outer membrane protein assembly factor BamB family protein [Streptodolium elevatio]
MELRQGAVRWTYDSYGTAAVSPAFAHGRIYVGGAGISALDPATGDVVWEQPTADIADCIPVVVDRTVIVTGGDLVALDADTGAVRWRRQPAPEGGFHHATYANGTIYVGIGTASVSARDPATGRELWRVAVDRHVTAPPRFAGGAVYVSCEGGLHALDAATGARRWVADAEGAGISAPTVVHGRVYVGMAMSANRGALGVRAYDAASGRTSWHRDTAGYVGSAPVFDAGTLYVGEAAGSVLALDSATGQVSWYTDTGDAGQGVTVADGIVYACGTWMLTALDARSGAMLWSSRPGAFGMCEPLIAGDSVVLCDDAGTLYAVIPPGSPD